MSVHIITNKPQSAAIQSSDIQHLVKNLSVTACHLVMIIGYGTISFAGSSNKTMTQFLAVLYK